MQPLIALPSLRSSAHALEKDQLREGHTDRRPGEIQMVQLWLRKAVPSARQGDVRMEFAKFPRDTSPGERLAHGILQTVEVR